MTALPQAGGAASASPRSNGMRWFRFAVLILAATILQTGLMGVLAVTGANIKPDLLLILLVFFAVRSSPRDAVVTSFTIGFAADLISPVMGLMGPRIISYGLAGTLLSDLHSIISTRRAAYQAVTIFLVGLVTAGLTYLLTLLRSEAPTMNLYAELLGQPLYSALLGPLLSWPVSGWMSMNRGRRQYRLNRLPSR
jgi:rod shape-determining protein MreD